MDIFEVIKERRSYRSFSERSVENSKIEMILEAANWAPSPANSQPWEFIVIKSDKARAQVNEIAEASFSSNIVEIHGFSYVRPLPYGDESAEEKPLSSKYTLSFLKKVPVIIAVVGIPDTNARQMLREKSSDGYKYACGAAIQNMLLTAHAQQLGSLWFTFFNGGTLSQYLNIDPGKHLVALVFIGYPGEDVPLSPGRFSIESKVRRIE